MVGRGRGGRSTLGLGLAIVAAAAVALLVAPGALASGQDDAGTGGDAGDAFGTATEIELPRLFEGTLDPASGDGDD